VLTFQNGLTAPDQLAAVVGAEHVLIGTTIVETTIMEPGVVGHLSPGSLVTVAALDGLPTPSAELVAQTLSAAGITTTVAPDGHRALWEKAMVLIPIATITAVCQAPLGPIRDLPATRALLLTLIAEVNAVARARGYDLSAAQKRAGGMIDRVAPTMKASMARDFERGSRTELEALTGALLTMGDGLGVDVPATRTAYAILKLRENAVGAGSALGILGDKR
jgi:2-dehydropantoate 2-reductase